MMTGVEVLPLADLKLENIQSYMRLFASRDNSARRDATLYESDREELSFTLNTLTEMQSL
jgi:hypothetical protein